MNKLTSKKHRLNAEARRRLIIEGISIKFQLKEKKVERILSSRPPYKPDGFEDNNSYGLSRLLYEAFPANRMYQYREEIQRLKNDYSFFEDIPLTLSKDCYPAHVFKKGIISVNIQEFDTSGAISTYTPSSLESLVKIVNKIDRVKRPSGKIQKGKEYTLRKAVFDYK